MKRHCLTWWQWNDTVLIVSTLEKTWKRYVGRSLPINLHVLERVYYLSILHALLENCKQELLAFKQFGRGGIQILIEDKIKPATTMYIPHGVYEEDDRLLRIPHALLSLQPGVIFLANKEQEDNQRLTASISGIWFDPQCHIQATNIQEDHYTDKNRANLSTTHSFKRIISLSYFYQLRITPVLFAEMS